MTDEQIGKHKGAIETLLHERKELSRILQIVESQLQRHMNALEEAGVDTDRFINELQEGQQQRQQQAQKKQQGRQNNQQRGQSRNQNRQQSRDQGSNRRSRNDTSGQESSGDDDVGGMLEGNDRKKDFNPNR